MWRPFRALRGDVLEYRVGLLEKSGVTAEGWMGLEALSSQEDTDTEL